eukprot:CAMPEP_0115036762 /NCGR_PEP_ID=MMETSP0216-20121206/42330_1 /TAXON_ID=223996 /ORGANISM="Protocruzia adherens, Strain Boccale" /LENGTH=1117 /DNA_ID=CAMNT_0002416681 /DNA_START=71 /DNA_END=3424 /DNA_ORIENTATION=-
MLADFYRNKSILVTGATGFVGKVLVEKLLYQYPSLRKVYLLIRSQKSATSEERFYREILSTPAFNRLRKRYGQNFNAFIREKIQVLSGDMLEEDFGLNDGEVQELKHNCQVVMNSAASVNLVAPLLFNLEINVVGTLRLFEMAREFHDLQIFTHVSTCYVNSDKSGMIEEKIYDDFPDPDECLEYLRNLSPEEVEKITPQLIGTFPNTYTFTKSFIERLLLKRRESMPLVFVRPPAIGAAAYEPMPGWTDSTDAPSSFLLAYGLGLMKKILGKSHLPGSSTPVDTIVGTIIVVSATRANTDAFDIFQPNLGYLNPFKWQMMIDYSVDYWRKYPSKYQAKGTVDLQLIPSKSLYQLYHLTQNKIPAFAFLQFANLTGNKKLIKKAQKFKKFYVDRLEMSNHVFTAILMKEINYKSEKLEALRHEIPIEDWNQFPALEVKSIDLKNYFRTFSYGVKNFILKEEASFPSPLLEDADFITNSITLRTTPSHSTSQGPTTFYHTQNLSQDILSSYQVQEAIKKQAKLLFDKKARKNTPISFEACMSKIVDQGTTIIRDLIGDCGGGVDGLMASSWIGDDIWRRLFEKIVIKEEELVALRRLCELERPLVLLGTNKSFVDFLLMAYVLHGQGLQPAHIQVPCGSSDISLFNRVVRTAGAFYLASRRGSSNPVARAIYKEYVKTLMENNATVQISLNSHRSRDGVIGAPDQLEVLNTIIETLMEGAVQEVNFLPININYERLFEMEVDPSKPFGETKSEENFATVLESFRRLSGNLGKVYVSIGEPISLNSYSGGSVKDQMSQKWANEIAKQWLQGVVAMPTSIVASVLLMNQQGMSEEELVHQFDWLCDQLLDRGVNLLDIEKGYLRPVVLKALDHLKQSLGGKPLLEGSTVRRLTSEEIGKLSYYKNNIKHIFWDEALKCCAFTTFIRESEGISAEEVEKSSRFLCELLRSEADIEKISPEIGSCAALATTDRRSHRPLFSFLNSLVYPLLDTHYATAEFLHSTNFKECNYSFNGIIERVQSFTQDLYHRGVLEFYESCTFGNVKQAIEAFERMDFIKRRRDVNPLSLKQQEWMTLSTNSSKLEEILERIEDYREHPFFKTHGLSAVGRRRTESDLNPLSRL